MFNNDDCAKYVFYRKGSQSRASKEFFLCYPNNVELVEYEDGDIRRGRSMTKEVINTAYLEKRLGVFDDSEEIVHLLREIDEYITQEAAVHIAGLYVLAQEMMMRIKKLEHCSK
jgi:hypothetical protein